MKRYRILALSMMFGTFIHAQTLEEAIKKTDNERYELAGKDFRTLIAKEGTKADNYFYYGENFYLADDLDSAKMIWKKGAEIDANNPLSMVGQGKSLWLSGDTLAGKKYFENALAITKNKNAEVMRQIGDVYVNAPIKSLKQGVTILNAAIKLDPKNADGHLLLGDALLELSPTNGTEAMKSYNKALDLSKSAKVIVRKAKVYQRAQNYELANDMYKEAQELDPTYAPTYRENAELNMRFNQSTRAIENWKKYLQLNNSDYARYRYATSLFTGKKYCEAADELTAIHANGFQNFYSARLLAYSIYECNAVNPNADIANYEKGMVELDKFFTIVPTDKIIGMDYKYKGLFYNKLNQNELSLQQLEKAAEVDSTIAPDIFAELAKIYMKDKNYDAAIVTFNKKMGSDSTKLTVAEYYELGRAYYFGPKNYPAADLANAKVAELAPTYAMAYFWRARANVQIDIKKETWAAKPFYEQFINTLTPEEKAGAYKPFVIEASKYLGDFYVNSKEKDAVKAKEIWGTVLELDPADKQAKAYFAGGK